MNVEQSYVPAIKWRQAEYQALLRLSDSAKTRIKPFVQIPPIEFDFEDRKPKRTVQEHIEPFSQRYKKKWKTRPAWIEVDVSLRTKKMTGGIDVVSHVFSELRQFKAQAVPVISLDYVPEVIAATGRIAARDGQGVAVRVRLEHIMRSDCSQKLAQLVAALRISNNKMDFVVDLGTPAYEPYDLFAGALIPALAKILDLSAYRSFVLIGTAFPESMTR